MNPGLAPKTRKIRQALAPVATRYDCDDKRPRPDENVSEGSVPSGWRTAPIFVDVEPMTCDDIF